MRYVIDPNRDKECYGKYKRNTPPNIPTDEIEEVDDFDGWSVISWRYEDW